MYIVRHGNRLALYEMHVYNSAAQYARSMHDRQARISKFEFGLEKSTYLSSSATSKNLESKGTMPFRWRDVVIASFAFLARTLLAAFVQLRITLRNEDGAIDGGVREDELDILEKGISELVKQLQRVELDRWYVVKFIS